jgi:hypothetical protein
VHRSNRAGRTTEWDPHQAGIEAIAVWAVVVPVGSVGDYHNTNGRGKESLGGARGYDAANCRRNSGPERPLT